MEANGLKRGVGLNKKRVKESWEYCSSSSCSGDILGFSWPPRSYTCSFCRREFRSAQALGGHMNVHRKERARLRQSPPPPLLPPPTTTTTKEVPHYLNHSHSVLPKSFVSSSSSLPSSTAVAANLSSSYSHYDAVSAKWASPGSGFFGDSNKMKNKRTFCGDHNMVNIAEEGGELGGIGELRLGLEIGLISSSNSNEDIDLELRLGCS